MARYSKPLQLNATGKTKPTGPVVTITNPLQGQLVSGTVLFTYTKAGNVTSVKWYVDGVLHGTSWDTTVETNDVHTIRLDGLNRRSQVVATQTITVTVNNQPDTTPPVVTITSPAGGDTVFGTVTITATATDNVAVAQVSFFANGVLLGHTGVAPYTQAWATGANGSYDLTAVAIDAVNNVGTSATVTVTVLQPIVDTTPPVVAVTSPASGSTVNGPVTVTVTATDNVAIASVQVLVNSVPIGTINSPTGPYTVLWQTAPYAPASVILQAKATDTAGNSTVTSARTITVTTPPDTVPPVVSVVSPVTGSTFQTGNITILADATDNVAVANVQFTIDGVNTGAPVTVAPYQYVWAATVGTHLIRAVATDTSGNTATSSPVGVHVVAPATGLLQPSDFTYLGFYEVAFNGLDQPYALALTGRVVAGDFRFIELQFSGGLFEWSIAGKSFGQVIDTPTNHWPDMWGDGRGQSAGRHYGLWWDEPNSKLWAATCEDYTVITYAIQLTSRTLLGGGAIGGLHGPVGLQGLAAKRVFGGVQPVPAAFQSLYSVPAYAVGFGGYTSLSAQGGGCSFGPTLYFIPDIAGYANNTEIPAGSIKTAMDFSSGVTEVDWYSAGHPTTFDRGARLTFPTNYCDNNDRRSNPVTPPTDPLPADAVWLSPAPDGKGRFVWGDGYNNTGCWINGATKQGFVAIATLGMGICWYGSSTIQWPARVYELHIFDPATLGQAAQGSISPWLVQPASMTQLTLPGMGGAGTAGCDPTHGAFNVSGAVYDPTARRLYIYGEAGGGTYTNRLYVYSVNA